MSDKIDWEFLVKRNRLWAVQNRIDREGKMNKEYELWMMGRHPDQIEDREPPRKASDDPEEAFINARKKKLAQCDRFLSSPERRQWLKKLQAGDPVAVLCRPGGRLLVPRTVTHPPIPDTGEEAPETGLLIQVDGDWLDAGWLLPREAYRNQKSEQEAMLLLYILVSKANQFLGYEEFARHCEETFCFPRSDFPEELFRDWVEHFQQKGGNIDIEWLDGAPMARYWKGVSQQEPKQKTEKASGGERNLHSLFAFLREVIGLTVCGVIALLIAKFVFLVPAAFSFPAAFITYGVTRKLIKTQTKNR